MQFAKDIISRFKAEEKKPQADRVERRLHALKGARLVQKQQWLLFKNQPSHSAA